MGAGYNWGYTNYSSYLGYGGGSMTAAAAYQAAPGLATYSSPVLDPLAPPNAALPVTSETTSPSGSDIFGTINAMS
jgi:hypothetical protein